MSSSMLFRLLCSLLFGGALALGLVRKRGDTLSPEQKWAPEVTPWLLPLFLALLFAVLVLSGEGGSLTRFGGMCMGIFLQMSIYYAVLLALGPLLRRRISARACAAMWLLPNFLYLCQQNFMRRSAPRRVLPLSGEGLHTAVIVWLAGAAAFFLWKCAEHLRFRVRLKKASCPETDEAVLRLWSKLRSGAGLMKPKLPLYRSRALTSPISVGLLGVTTFVVLPETEYSEAELKLILRHELIHITRRDAQTKLFLTLFTAFCWFDPLMWLAVRRCSEDLELGCDELVLEGADETEKERYAALILRSAGETRGFTSNLSATARSLRYRLGQITAPRGKRTGAAAAGLALTLLLLSNGTIAFAYGSGTLAERVLAGAPPAVEHLGVVDLGERDEYGSTRLEAYDCPEAPKLLDYLCSMRVCSLSGNYSAEESGTFLELWIPGSEKPRILILGEHSVRLVDFGTKYALAEQFYLEEPPDWDYIRSLLTKREAEASVPQPPNMLIRFGPEPMLKEDKFTATGRILENTLDGVPSERFSAWEESSCAVEGFPLEWAEIAFDIEIAPQELTVTAQTASGERQSTDADENGRITLLSESARYTAEACWEFATDAGMQVYRMEYCFDVTLPEK